MIFIVLIAAGIVFFIYARGNDTQNKTANTTNNENNSSYQSTRTSTSDNTDSSQSTETEQSTQKIQENSTSLEQGISNSQPPPIEPEKEIAAFSTKIYNKDSARQNNISITCSTLNGTIVKNGETFSFCNTVGQATSNKGYQKADIFDKDGNKKKGLGGGNCQISTTLYNAVLPVPSLVVTERHAHSNYVPYIERGKDAAVAYGSYDLKFRNDSGKDIKILAEASPNAVTVKIVQ